MEGSNYSRNRFEKKIMTPAKNTEELAKLVISSKDLKLF